MMSTMVAHQPKKYDDLVTCVKPKAALDNKRTVVNQPSGGAIGTFDITPTIALSTAKNVCCRNKTTIFRYFRQKNKGKTMSPIPELVPAMEPAPSSSLNDSACINEEEYIDNDELFSDYE
ncbi:hypothetical protein FQR65_LT05943 [Abscondita terminalis]|nr:hypothetical protein FQR65_LT05943 [Abscondita terminalis]